jgi:hypothetical protein
MSTTGIGGDVEKARADEIGEGKKARADEVLSSV